MSDAVPGSEHPLPSSGALGGGPRERGPIPAPRDTPGHAEPREGVPCYLSPPLLPERVQKDVVGSRPGSAACRVLTDGGLWPSDPAEGSSGCSGGCPSEGLWGRVVTPSCLGLMCQF